MKKLTTLIISVLFFATISSSLTSCLCKHEWNDATCTTPKTCSLCNETEGEPLGHEFEEATCILPEVCSICNAENGEALGHTIIVDAAVEPTCTENGLTEGSHCEVCNEIIISQNDVEKLEHTVGEWELTDEATLTDNGTETMYCTVCGDFIDSRDIDKKTPNVIGSSFNFTDDEFIDWIEEISYLEVGRRQPLDSDMNTAYLMTNANGDTGVLLLNHGSNGLRGSVCGIMVYFDSPTDAMATVAWIGEKINSNFVKEDAARMLSSNKSYTSASMTIMELDIGGMSTTALAPSEFFVELLA